MACILYRNSSLQPDAVMTIGCRAALSHRMSAYMMPFSTAAWPHRAHMGRQRQQMMTGQRLARHGGAEQYGSWLLSATNRPTDSPGHGDGRTTDESINCGHRARPLSRRCRKSGRLVLSVSSSPTHHLSTDRLNQAQNDLNAGLKSDILFALLVGDFWLRAGFAVNPPIRQFGALCDWAKAVGCGSTVGRYLSPQVAI